MSWHTFTIDQVKSDAPYSLVGGPFGSELTTRDYTEAGVPIIRGSNLSSDRKFFDDGYVFVSDEKAATLRSNTAYPGDIVFTQRGTLGQVGLIPQPSNFERYVVSQSQMKLTVNRQLALPAYVYYWFRQSSVAEMIRRRAITSGVPHINLGILKGFEIRLPSLVHQQNAVRVLDDFECLIENNHRRIQLLEESARLLYREWFVHLRFPGHEHNRIVDGLPEGWERRTLESVCSSGDGVQTGPFGSQLHQADYSDGGVPVIMPKDIVDCRISVTSIARIPETLADSLGRHRMAPGDIVYGRRGDIGRRAFIGKHHAGWFCGTGCLRFRPNLLAINPLYLFDTLGAPDTLGTITNRAKGSTMPNLSAGALKSVPLLVASRRLQDIYVERVEDMREALNVLDEQNQKLAQARDLLLPRLMSGELRVADLASFDQEAVA